MRMEQRDGCIFVHGAVTASALAELCERAPKGAVIDTDLARMAGADMAIATPEEAKRIKARLAAEFERKLESEPQIPGRDPALRRWLATGERGASSDALVAFLADEPAAVRDHGEEDAHPWDPADLARCRLLLEQVPSLQAAFDTRAALLSPVWKRMVAEWRTLCATMDEECPQWREHKGRAPRTWALMKTVIAGETGDA